MTQEGDVILELGADGFELPCEHGLVSMGGGLSTAVLLSLLGGNEAGEWWGNLLTSPQARKIQSDTLRLISSEPMTSGNLRRLESAIVSDLAWLISEQVASSVTATARATAAGRVSASVDIVSPTGESSAYKYSINWEKFP